MTMHVDIPFLSSTSPVLVAAFLSVVPTAFFAPLPIALDGVSLPSVDVLDPVAAIGR